MKFTKCKPQKQPKGYNCTQKFNKRNLLDPEKLFFDNTHDIARTFVEVLVLSGIRFCMANAAKDILLNAFVFYDSKRKGKLQECYFNFKFSKNEVIFSLECDSGMSKIEALFAYSIMKHLLKAFFVNKGNPKKDFILEAQEIYDQQFVWDHVVRRILSTFEGFENIFRASVVDYREQIKRVVKELFERMKARVDTVQSPVCKCDDSSNSFDTKSKESYVLVACAATSSNGNLTSDECSEAEAEAEAHAEGQPCDPFEYFAQCVRCKYAKQLCRCNIDPVTKRLCLESSQGPFQCDWYETDKKYRIKDHECPCDCLDSRSNSSCSASEDTSEHETESVKENGELPENSSSEIYEEETEIDSEDNDVPMNNGDLYCCHKPLCNMEPFAPNFGCKNWNFGGTNPFAVPPLPEPFRPSVVSHKSISYNTPSSSIFEVETEMSELSEGIELSDSSQEVSESEKSYDEETVSIEVSNSTLVSEEFEEKISVEEQSSSHKKSSSSSLESQKKITRSSSDSTKSIRSLNMSSSSHKVTSEDEIRKDDEEYVIKKHVKDDNVIKKHVKDDGPKDTGDNKYEECPRKCGQQKKKKRLPCCKPKKKVVCCKWIAVKVRTRVRVCPSIC